MKKKVRAKLIINICLALFFLVCVIIPLVSMLLRISGTGFSQVVGSAQFGEAIWNSVSTALTATVITLILSLWAAMSLERTTIRLKAVFGVIFVVPMLIPSISHAFGLVALFGSNGFVTNLLGISGGIYGFWGIVTGSVMYSFPVAFLMFSGILKYEDGMTYKACDVLGIPSYRRFLDITLPYIRKTLISAFFAVFTMIVTDYGVPLMIGGKKITLSVLMYNKAVGMIDYDSGSVIGTFLLLPAVVAFVVDLINPENIQGAFVSETVMPTQNRLKELLSYVYCTVISILIISPIAAFCVMVCETKYPVDPAFTLEHIQRTMEKGAGEFLVYSLLYAVLAGILGTVLAFVCAYFTARVRGKFSRALHLISITSMAIPGIVLGLSYVIFFHNSFIYGTVIVVVLVNSIHFFASPYLMMYNTLAKVNPNLEDVGNTLGVRRMFIVKDVIVPKVKYTLYEMFSYFFVNSMMTISAISFLAPPAPKALALMINQFEAQRLMESAAFVSLLILAVNLIVKVVIHIIKNREDKQIPA